MINAGASIELGESQQSVVTIDSRPGLTVQRNVGLQTATGDLVAFIDDDVELEPDYFEQMRGWFSLNVQCIGASGRIENDVPYSGASRAFRRVFALGTADGMLRRSGDAIYLYQPLKPTRVEFLSGSNMVWRRSALGKLAFDEALGGYAYMEDVDFSLRAAPLGELWMVPKARLVHNKTATSRVPQRAYVRQVLANGAYLYSKHRRCQNLRLSSYSRRVAGRVLAYAGIAVANRSVEPLVGILQGLRDIPRMIRAGKNAGR